MNQPGQVVLFRFPQTDLEEGKLHEWDVPRIREYQEAQAGKM